MSNWYELAGSPVEEENVNPITNYNQITTSTEQGDWWCSEHDARTNYNLLNDPDLVSGNWWDLGITPLDNFGGAPSLPTLFDWNPEAAEALPATATFTRASTAQVLTTTDGTTNWYQEAKSGELRLDGLRRVENLLDSSNGTGPFSNITKDGRLAVSVIASNGTLTINIGGTPQVFTPTGTPQRFVAFDDATGGSTSVTISGTATLSAPMAHLCQVGNDIPEPYVAHDQEFGNVGVNGVRNFNTANTSSVDGNGVVTEASGSTITGGGYLPEPAATNLALHSRDFTNAAWVATNITPAQDATGIDGATQASTLTATAANGTILQSFTRASSAHTFAVFVARKTGTGTIEMTIDGGTTWVDITSNLTSDITDRFTVTQTLANPSIGFRIVTSGDEIEVDVAQLEAAAFATSPIITSGSAVTRVADVLTDSTVWTAEHSCVLDMTWPDVLPAFSTNVLGFSGANRVSPVSGVDIGYFNGLSMSAVAATSREGERHKIGFSAETNNGVIVDDEGNSGTDTIGTVTFGMPTQIGHSAAQNDHFRGVMHKIEIWSVTQTQQELENRVS